MQSIYIIESPFQLMCAQEHVSSSSGDCVLYLLLEAGTRNKEQIYEVIDLNKWSSVFTIHTPKIFLFKYYVVLNILKKLKNTKLDNVVIGEYRSIISHVLLATLQYNQSWLVDDGMSTLVVYERYFTKGLPLESTWRFIRLKKIIAALMGFKINIIKNINLFTIFPLESIGDITVKKNKMLGYSNRKVKILPEDVYFLGANYIDANLMGSSNYYELLWRVAQYYHDKNVFYFPHRRESRDDLKKHLQDLNWTLSEIDAPIENYFLNSNSIPKIVAGIASTALFTIKSIYGKSGISVEYLEVPKDMWLNDEDYSVCYSCLSLIGKKIECFDN